MNDVSWGIIYRERLKKACALDIRRSAPRLSAYSGEMGSTRRNVKTNAVGRDKYMFMLFALSFLVPLLRMTLSHSLITLFRIHFNQIAKSKISYCIDKDNPIAKIMCAYYPNKENTEGRISYPTNECLLTGCWFLWT